MVRQHLSSIGNHSEAIVIYSHASAVKRIIACKRHRLDHERASYRAPRLQDVYSFSSSLRSAGVQVVNTRSSSAVEVCNVGKLHQFIILSILMLFFFLTNTDLKQLETRSKRTKGSTERWLPWNKTKQCKAKHVQTCFVFPHENFIFFSFLFTL